MNIYTILKVGIVINDTVIWNDRFHYMVGKSVVVNCVCGKYYIYDADTRNFICNAE